MTRDEAVSIIQQQLGFRSDLSTQIITQLKFAQQTLEMGATKPGFMISSETSMVTVAASQSVSVPSGFLEEADQASIRYVPTTITAETPEVDLRKDEYDVLRGNYMDATTGTLKTGTPKAYALLGATFKIFPVPAAIYTLKVFFLQNDTVLSSNIENNWLLYFPMLLVGKAGGLIASALRDNAAMNVFARWEAEGTAILVRQTYDREFANQDMQVGGPH